MGRAPTSGYCHNCRRRRIKCDLGRPECGRCLKSGYECKGYDLPMRMEHMGVVQNSRGGQQLMRIHLGTTESAKFTTRLDLSAFRETMAFSFFFASYSWGPFWRPLMQLTPARVEDNPDDFLQYTGSQAVVYGFFGLRNHDAALQVEGRRLYGQAMREMRGQLRREVKMSVAHLAASVMVLAMYPYAVDNDAHMAHHLGLSKILQYCGPAIFQKEPLLSTFRSCRGMLICHAFAKRRRTFLEVDRWKAVPWEFVGKTTRDQLRDIIVYMPGLAEDLLSGRGPSNLEQAYSYYEKIESLSTQLGEWRLAWEEFNPGVAREVPSDIFNQHKLGDPYLAHLLSTSIEFDSLGNALDIMTYNAAMIYTSQLRILLSLCPAGYRPPSHCRPAPLPGTTRPDPPATRGRERGLRSPLLLPGETQDEWQPALEIVRIIPSLRLSHSDTAEYSDLIVIAPIAIAYSWLRRRPELAGLFAPLLDRIPFFRDAEMELDAYDILAGV